MFGKLFLASVAIIAIWMFFILILSQNQKAQRCVSPFIKCIRLKLITFKDLIHIAAPIIAILIASYALHKDSVRDNESSHRYSDSVTREKDQHNEIINVYAEQKELLIKYNQNADSMLAQLKVQAKIAKLQYENQVILTQPVVVTKLYANDTLKTSINFDNENWIMPIVKFEYANNGDRTAKDFTFGVTFISPVKRTIQKFKEVIEPFLYSKTQNFINDYPTIPWVDKNLFFIIIDSHLTDELNINYNQQERFYLECVRDKNNIYTIIKMNEAYIELSKRILNNPSKVITPNVITTKYLNETFF